MLNIQLNFRNTNAQYRIETQESGIKLKEGIQLITRPHIPAPVVAHVTLLPCMHVVQHKPDKLLFSTSPSHNYEDAY